MRIMRPQIATAACRLGGFRLPSPPIQQSPLFFSDQKLDGNRFRRPRWTSHPQQHNYQSYGRRNFYNPLFAGNNDGESDSSEQSKKKSSMKRVGGRRRQPKRQQDNVVQPSKNKLPSGSFLVVALLVLTLLKNLLFGGINDSGDYYYYSYSSSSTYETRINPDGSRTTTETSRKENSDLKTNIPGLTEKDFLDRSSNRDRAFTNYFYLEE